MIPMDWLLVAKGWHDANSPRRAGGAAPSAELHRKLMEQYG